MEELSSLQGHPWCAWASGAETADFLEANNSRVSHLEVFETNLAKSVAMRINMPTCDRVGLKPKDTQE